MLANISQSRIFTLQVLNMHMILHSLQRKNPLNPILKPMTCTHSVDRNAFCNAYYGTKWLTAIWQDCPVGKFVINSSQLEFQQQHFDMSVIGPDTHHNSAGCGKWPLQILRNKCKTG